MTVAKNPFADIRDMIRSLPGPDENALAAVRAREAELTKPAGSLGKESRFRTSIIRWWRFSQAITAL
jgi:nicotinate-nucleotide--dimethylbenzimidazole phosphoribosyltransferase